jgi:hypothetical protein
MFNLLIYKKIYHNNLELKEIYTMRSKQVHNIIDIGKLIFVKKKILILIEILRKLFFTCNPHFVPPLFSD